MISTHVKMSHSGLSAHGKLIKNGFIYFRFHVGANELEKDQSLGFVNLNADVLLCPALYLRKEEGSCV